MQDLAIVKPKRSVPPITIAEKARAGSRLTLHLVVISILSVVLPGLVSPGWVVGQQPSVDADELSEVEVRDLGLFREEMAETITTYQTWGISRSVLVYETDDPLEFDSIEESLKRLTPVSERADRFLRHNDNYRVDNTTQGGRQRSYGFDGVLARYRDEEITHNGKRLTASYYLEDTFVPDLPHSLLSRSGSLGDFRFLFRYPMTSARYSRLRSGWKLSITQQELDQHPCWRVTWRSSNRYNEGARNELWLARDRGLLPLRLITNDVQGSGIYERQESRIDRFEMTSTGGTKRWLAGQTTTLRRTSSESICFRYELEGISLSDADKSFTEIPPINSDRVKPPVVKVQPYVPFSVFDSLAVTASRFSGAQQIPHFRSWSLGLGILVALVIACLVPIWTRRGIGKRTQQWVHSHPLTIGVLGVVIVGIVFIVCAQPKGWYRYGFAMVAASTAGFVVIAITMLLAGKKAISLRATLVLSACAAMFLSGYSKGFRRLQTRQQMISEIREAGGQLNLVSWEIQPDGVAMPGPLGELVDESWTSALSGAAIPASIFDQPHVRRWCLDEGGFVGVGKVDFQPFQVDNDALEQLAQSDAIWGLHFERGRLDSAGLELLQHFAGLEFLAFDCQSKPLPDSFVGLQEINKLRLENPVVDQRFFDIISSLTKLKQLVLVTPNIKPTRDPKINESLREIKIEHSTVDSVGLSTLGSQRAEIRLRNCKLNLTGKTQVAMSEATALEILGSDLNDKTLARFVEIPNIQNVMLIKTNVTYDGFEAFSLLHPSIEISIQ